MQSKNRDRTVPDDIILLNMACQGHFKVTSRSFNMNQVNSRSKKVRTGYLRYLLGKNKSYYFMKNAV